MISINSIYYCQMEVLYSDDANAIKNYLLTEEGIKNINNPEKNKTPLFRACSKNRNDVVEVLISFGADVNLPSTEVKETPLHKACKKGHIDIVSKLLCANADANIQTEYGLLPITYAAVKGNLDIIKILTPCTNFSLPEKSGSYLFRGVLHSHNVETMNYLFDFCYDINHCDNFGFSYLHIANIYGNDTAIKFLIDRGIDISIRDNEGRLASDVSTTGVFKLN